MSVLAAETFLMQEEKKGKIGDVIEASGNYICQGCGHFQFFEIGDEFEDCQSCYEPDIVWELEE